MIPVTKLLHLSNLLRDPKRACIPTKCRGIDRPDAGGGVDLRIIMKNGVGQGASGLHNMRELPTKLPHSNLLSVN